MQAKTSKREPVKGKILQIIGPVIDVAFDEGSALPNIYDSLEVKSEKGEVIVLECQYDIGENTVRTIAMDSTDGLRRGMEVTERGGPISMPATEEIRGRLFNVIGAPDLTGLVKFPGSTLILSTGIRPHLTSYRQPKRFCTPGSRSLILSNLIPKVERSVYSGAPELGKP